MCALIRPSRSARTERCTFLKLGNAVGTTAIFDTHAVESSGVTIRSRRSCVHTGCGSRQPSSTKRP